MEKQGAKEIKPDDEEVHAPSPKHISLNGIETSVFCFLD